MACPPQITVPPGKRDIEISYASLDLGAGERSRFKYRLNEQGQQSGWQDDAGGNRLASYPRLLPGTYQFQVTACNEDGLWNQNPASLTIVVEPQFWQRGWFQGLMIACLLAAIAAAVYYFSTQKLQRQLAVLRQQEALEHERARIARDIHDQLGANLTQVALLGEMVESDKDHPDEVEAHARQISQTARETTRALDEIVWTVNPSNDTLDGLVNYVCKYAQEYLALAGLRYRAGSPGAIAQDVPSPRKSATTSSSPPRKPSTTSSNTPSATAATIRLRLEPDGFTLEIEDDGRGSGRSADKATGPEMDCATCANAWRISAAVSRSARRAGRRHPRPPHRSDWPNR